MLLALVVVLATALCPAQAPSSNDPEALWDRATLYRDEWGVPHIYAEDPRAMAFALGYAQAEDHLEELLLAYRYANGRAAEILGERMVASDTFAIQMQHAELARDAFEEIDDLTRDLCEGLALGINTWLIEHTDVAPPWAEGVNPADVLALMHAYLMSMAPFDQPDTYRPDRGTPSANAWAVDSSLSETGDPILVINPHTDYDGVFQWYEAHLSTDTLDMAGATLFGLPVILQGHNETLGWALAPNEPDFADLYVERLTDSWLKRAPQKELYVLTEKGLELRWVVQTGTAHGPLVAGWGSEGLMYTVGGYGQFGAIRQFYRMGEATTLDAFRDALDLHELPAFHIVYADVEGNIFYRYTTIAGQRLDRDPANANEIPDSEELREALLWDKPIPGNEPQLSWGEIIPAADLPTVLNPESGYVQACGTPPWLVTSDSGLNEEDWPRWLAREPDSHRAERVRHLLEQGPRSFHDHQSMLYDLLVPVAAKAVPFLLKAAADNPRYVSRAHPDLLVGLDTLADWNYTADPDSAAMTYFHVWWSVLQANYHIPTRSIAWLSTFFDRDVPDLQFAALDAAAEAAKLMRNEFQTLFVPWGEVHTLRRGNRTVGMPGSVSGEPIFLTWDRDYEDGSWPVNGGYAFAMAVRFGEEVEAVSLTPFGTSENPESPHFDDQLDLLLERRFKRTHYDRREVEAHAKSAIGTKITLRHGASNSTIDLRALNPVRAGLTVSGRFPVGVPRNIAAFTPYIEPIIEPHDTPVELDISFEVPERVCAADDLWELAVYAYTAQTGWRYVEEQMLDAERRTFLARAYGSQVYAVMGPRNARLGDPMAGDPADLRVAKRAEETEAAAQLETPKFEDLESLVPEFILEPALEYLAESIPAFDEKSPVPEPVQSIETDRPEEGAPVSAKGDTRPETIAVDTAQDSAGPKTPEESASPEPTEFTRQEFARKAEVFPIAENGEGARGNVTWTGKSLAEIRGRSTPRHESFLLAPDAQRASALAVGRELHLRPPVSGAVFHLVMSKTVRAQVMIENGPPGPLPEGTVSFSPVFTILRSPETVAGSAAISLQLEAGLCPPEHLATLALFAYDREHGWQRVEGQKMDPISQSFSALDFGLRTYAILGPAEHLLRPPANGASTP